MTSTPDLAGRKPHGENCGPITVSDSISVPAGSLQAAGASRLAGLTVADPPQTEAGRQATRQGRSITLSRRVNEVAAIGRDAARGPAVLKALDHLGVGLFLVNRQGYVTDCNEAASELLGLDHLTDREQRHVSNLTAVFAGDVTEQIDRLLSDGRQCVRREITLTGREDHPVMVTLCALPADDSGAADVVGIMREPDADRTLVARAKEELSILAEVAAALSSSLDLKQILRIILTGATASQGVGFNRAFLFLYERTRHELVAHMAVGPSSAEEAGRIWSRLAGMQLSLAQMLDDHRSGTDESSDHLFERIRGLVLSLDEESLIARACDTGVWVNLQKASEIDPVTQSLLDRTGVRNGALIPLVSKGNCQGLIVADNGITGAPISDDAVRVLKVLADQAAVAVQRARLHDSERERTRELERTYRRLTASQEQVVRAEKMSVMGEITAAVAEELRNPLTIIGGFVNLVRGCQRCEDGREYLNIIESEVRRAEGMLRQVIEFASASSRQNQVFDFSALASSVVERLSVKGEGVIPVSFSAATERLLVLGNPDQLGSALHQLLQLVVEETSAEARLDVRTDCAEGRARLTVAFSVEPNRTERLVKLLEQMFARQTSSLRLQVLVAGETVKYHGGDYSLKTTATGLPLLMLEVPLFNERKEPA